MMYGTNIITPHGKDNTKMTSHQERSLPIVDTPGTFLYNSRRKNGF